MRGYKVTKEEVTATWRKGGGLAKSSKKRRGTPEQTVCAHCIVWASTFLAGARHLGLLGTDTSVRVVLAGKGDGTHMVRGEQRFLSSTVTFRVLVNARTEGVPEPWRLKR